MPQLFFPQGESHWFPLDRLGGPPSWSECGGKEKEPLLARARNWTLVVQPIG